MLTGHILSNYIRADSDAELRSKTVVIGVTLETLANYRATFASFRCSCNELTVAKSNFIVFTRTFKESPPPHVAIVPELENKTVL